MFGTDNRPFAVVTGGSSGIGYELARQFADNELIGGLADITPAPVAAEMHRALSAPGSDKKE